MDTFATVILSVLTSSVAAAVISHISSARREQNLFLRQRYEALYTALEKWNLNFSTRMIPYSALLRGKIDRNAFDSLVIDAGAKSIDGNPLGVIDMLVNIYFPHLLPELRNLKSALESVNDIVEKYDRMPPSLAAISGLRHVTPFEAACDGFDAATQSLKDAIVSSARNLAGPARLLSLFDGKPPVAERTSLADEPPAA